MDRSFLTGVPDDAAARRLFDGVLTVARANGGDVVIEGIETLSQCDYVERAGARLGQGYGLARPLPTDQAKTFLLERLAPDRRWTLDLREPAQRG